MRNKVLNIASVIVVSLMFIGSASADVMAGWSFGQFRVTNSLEGFSGGTVPANYSDLIPRGVGQYTQGSASISGMVPTAGNLTANLDGTQDGLGTNPFDSQTLEIWSGQTYASLMSLTTKSAGSVTFNATPDQDGTSWGASFGAKTLEGTATIGVSYSVDGGAYVSAPGIAVTTTDAVHAISLPSTQHGAVSVRLDLDSSSGQTVIDNFAIHATPVPEPAAAAAFFAGVVGLLALKRRRDSLS